MAFVKLHLSSFSSVTYSIPVQVYSKRFLDSLCLNFQVHRSLVPWDKRNSRKSINDNFIKIWVARLNSGFLQNNFLWFEYLSMCIFGIFFENVLDSTHLIKQEWGISVCYRPMLNLDLFQRKTIFSSE